jgi:hypothetical protein
MTLVVTEEQAPPAAMQLAAFKTQHLVLGLPTFGRSDSGTAGKKLQHRTASIVQMADGLNPRPVRVPSMLSRTSLTLVWGFCNMALLLSNRCPATCGNV